MMMGVIEGAEGDTEIAASVVRVDPGASPGLAFAGDDAAMVADAPCALAHWRSNVIGLK